jgi:hypothetical protein
MQMRALGLREACARGAKVERSDARVACASHRSDWVRIYLSDELVRDRDCVFHARLCHAGHRDVLER